MAPARTELGLAIALVGLAACKAVPPDVNQQGGDYDAGTPYADTVLAFSTASAVTTCTTALPACGDPPTACAANAALGPPDGASFTIPDGGRLELGFRCGVVLERGVVNMMNTPDLAIHAMVTAGQATVEVSLDGSSYQLLGQFDKSEPTFDLADVPVTAVRFVRIIDGGGGGVAIDSVEALR